MVRLELQYLYEIGQVSIPAEAIILDLGDHWGLRIVVLINGIRSLFWRSPVGEFPVFGRSP